MSPTQAAEAITKLQGLSEQRAKKVISLIDDLVALEAYEHAVNLKDARVAPAEMNANADASPDSKTTTGKAEFADNSDDIPFPECEPRIPYEQRRRELGLDS